MTRIDRRRHRRAEIDIAEPEHEIARRQHDALHRVDRFETIDPADELDIRWTPGRVGTHQLVIFAHGELD
jgi:hypothetical protein